jgi:alpha-L-arabinofuranosidase
VTRDSKSGNIYVKVVNCSEASGTIEVAVEGAQVEAEGEELILRASPQDTNSIDEPSRIAPVEGLLLGMGGAFEHTFPEYSVTVIELHIAKKRG